MFRLYNFVIVIINCTKVSLFFKSTLFKTLILFYGKSKKYFESATKLYKVNDHGEFNWGIFETSKQFRCLLFCLC